MSRSLQRITTCAFAIILSVFCLTTPVFADPDPNLPTPPAPETTIPTDETPEENEPENNDEDTDSEQETETESATDADDKANTCYDQVGALGWIVCPGGSLLGSLIDGVYGFIEDTLVVKPISTDTKTPFYLVWSYLRDLANILFIIFFIFVIYSQITGLGISNYGIKRILPRLIIAVILVNLSYIICTIAVDLSNITGIALRNFFTTITETAVENGTISSDAFANTFTSVTKTILFGAAGTGLAILAIDLAGGFMSVFWMLIPLLISGAIAVLSAAITLAARQALTILLVMISPLALIFYFLPNTKKWFDQWKKLLFTMLIFFPNFSILFGASKLAGLIMVTSASSAIGILLGMAVMVIPLFLTIPLMRMSGTVLGRIDGFVQRAGNSPRSALGRMSDEHREIARRNHLAKSSGHSVARWMHRREAIRANDLKHAGNVLTSKDNSDVVHSHYRRNGQLNKRGLNYYNDQGRILKAQNLVNQFDTDMDEGFKGDGSDKRIRNRDNAFINNANRDLLKAVDQSKIISARAESVRLDNAQTSATRIQNALKNIHSKDSDEEAHLESIRQATAESFNYEYKSQTELKNMSQQQVDAYNAAARPAISAILANAISDKRIADNNMQKRYLEYFNDMPAGPEIGKALSQAFDEKNYNAMTSAIQIMGNRGDFDKIEEIVREKSKLLNDDRYIKAQKTLAEALLAYKTKDPLLWAWGKSLLMRRGMHEGEVASGKLQTIDGYIDFDSFDRGVPAGKDDASSKFTPKVSRTAIISGIDDYSFVKTLDRTFFKSILANRINGSVPDASDLGLTHKQIRTAIVSGRDGEALDTINALITGGYRKIANGKAEKNEIDFFNNNKQVIENNLIDLIGQMSATQVASLKTATVNEVNETLIALGDTYTTKNVDGKNVNVSNKLYNMLENQRNALNQPNLSSQRNSMNSAVRQMLGINLS